MIVDVEEIIGVLRELVKTRQFEGHDTAITETFSVGVQESNEIGDLPRIVKAYRREFRIEVGGDWTTTSLIFRPWILGTFWITRGFTKEASWIAYHKLESIFKRRRRRLGAFLRSLPWWSSFFLGLALELPIFVVPIARTHLTSAYLIVFGLLLILAVVFARGTLVLPRYSWDTSPIWVYLREKIVPIVASFILGVLGTLLAMYLKLRNWP